MNSVRGVDFATEVAKRYGEGSEMLGYLRQKRQENGTDTENHGREEHSVSSSQPRRRRGSLGGGGDREEGRWGETGNVEGSRNPWVRKLLGR